jgi:hypothetical protein
MAYDFSRVFVLGAGLMAAACASAGAAGDPLVLYPSSPEAQQARLRGRLSLEGACLYIVGEGGERWLAAFPSPGTRWDPAENAVQVGTRTLRVGETGAFAGGEAPNAPGAIRWVQPPAASCESAKLWMVSTLMDP